MTTNVEEADFAYSDHLCLREGFMYCEDVRLRDIQDHLEKRGRIPVSPVYVFSKAQLRDNVRAYQSALQDSQIPFMLGYSMKANHNPAIVKLLRAYSCAAVTVSGMEIKLAINCGFDPAHIVLNGNGKQPWELELAVESGCLVNVDSEFDLRHLSEAAALIQKKVNVLFRLNPDIDAKIHPYLATGLAASKFGIEQSQLRLLIDFIKRDPWLELVGLHCHLGSTIDTTDVFSECVDILLELTDEVKSLGINTLRFLNLGGGLGIDYRKHFARTAKGGTVETNSRSSAMPTPADLIHGLKDKLLASGLTLILEPGRSLIGSAAILLTKTIGCKKNRNVDYIVVDASMNEVIRPSLYGAYHHIELTEPSQAPAAERRSFDIVGPVCECTDFLGKERLLLHPHEDCGVAIFDAGAYCGSMASNYNLRMRPAEVMVEGTTWSIIRQPDEMNDFMAPYRVSEEEAN